MPLKLDISNPKIRKYIFDIAKIGRIIKLDTGIKFGNSKPKMFLETGKI